MLKQLFHCCYIHCAIYDPQNCMYLPFCYHLCSLSYLYSRGIYITRQQFSMKTSLFRSLLLGIIPLISGEKSIPSLLVPRDNTECSGRYPGGGHCTPNPTSPWCEEDAPICMTLLQNQVWVDYHCCKNCYDAGCSKMGEG